MKKSLLILIVIFLIASVNSTQEEKQLYKECNQQCKDSRLTAINECSLVQCKADCGGLNSCISKCSTEIGICLRQANEEQRVCRNQCKQVLAPKCSTQNITYLPGEKFQEGCDICECRKNGNIKCKREPFCHKNPLIPEALCSESGGFYQSICKGGMFSLQCNPSKFCLCDGINEYSCPANYECYKEFKLKISGTGIPYYTSQLGSPLGDIGICVSNSSLNQ